MPTIRADLCAATLLLVACGPTISLEETGMGTGGGGAGGGETGSSYSSGSSTGPEVVNCEPDATACEASEYGIWRLSSAGQIMGHLYLWPDGDEPFSFTSRWYAEGLQNEDASCIRNGRYESSGSLEGTFVFETRGSGGTITAPCGGDPQQHALRLEFTRLPACAGEVFAVVATDSNATPAYNFTGEAVHCDCTTSYDPYSGAGTPLPLDNCVTE